MKKILCILLTFVMVTLSFVSVTFAFNDISLTDNSYEAIKVLSDLDILKGDESGNFNPNNKVKRSELAAILCRTLGQENAATSTVSKFNDVATNHWAVGYISWAAGKGIVNGYGDGNFKPDNDVTYQEAVKMLMCAMGYGPLAESESYGGYPYGYLSLAGTYGVTEGISANPSEYATRAIIAELIYNALNAPLVEKSYNSIGEVYNVYNGTKTVDYVEKTLLSQYLNIIKVKAKVVANYKTNSNLITKDGKHKIELANVKYYNKTDEENADDYVINKPFVGNTNAADFIGNTVDVYISIDDNDDAIIKSIIANTKKTETLVVAKDIETIEYQDGVFTFEYWEDIDRDNKVTAVDTDEDVIVYINNEKVDALDLNINDIAKVEFVGEKGNDFDQVFITVYTYKQVKEVNVNKEIIVVEDGSIKLNEDARSKTFTYTIYKNGEIIGLEDLSEDDVLSIVWAGNDSKTNSFVDIYVSDTTVKGMVTGKKLDKYYINRIEYISVKDNLTVGDEGIFYLTHDNKIYDTKTTTSLSNNYAYILQVGKENVFDVNSYQIKLFTKEGKTVTYNVSSKVKIDDKTYNAEKGEQDTKFNNISKLVSSTDTKAEAITNSAKRLITYTVSGDEITKINFITGKECNGTYKESTNKFGNYYLNDSSKLFYAPVSYIKGKGWNVDNSDIAVLNTSALDKDEIYNTYVYNVEDRNIGVALFVDELPFAGKDTALAVITSVANSLNNEGDKAIEITVFQSGEYNSYILHEDIDTKLTEGNIIQFVTNDKKEIYNLDVIYDGELKGVDTDKVQFIAGYVKSYKDGAYTINTNEYTFDYTSNCTLALVNEAKFGTKGYVTEISSFSEFETMEYTDETYIMVAKIVEGEIIDAIEYKID